MALCYGEANIMSSTENYLDELINGMNQEREELNDLIAKIESSKERLRKSNDNRLINCAIKLGNLLSLLKKKEDDFLDIDKETELLALKKEIAQEILNLFNSKSAYSLKDFAKIYPKYQQQVHYPIKPFDTNLYLPFYTEGMIGCAAVLFLPSLITFSFLAIFYFNLLFLVPAFLASSAFPLAVYLTINLICLPINAICSVLNLFISTKNAWDVKSLNCPENTPLYQKKASLSEAFEIFKKSLPKQPKNNKTTDNNRFFTHEENNDSNVVVATPLNPTFATVISDASEMQEKNLCM